MLKSFDAQYCERFLCCDCYEQINKNRKYEFKKLCSLS